MKLKTLFLPIKVVEDEPRAVSYSTDEKRKH